MSAHRCLTLSTALTAASLLAACTSPQDPFTSGAARATVSGIVTAPGGAPRRATPVHIVCAGGGPAVVASTDSTGRYVTNVETGSSPFDGASGKLLCHLAEPTREPARAEVDTALSFTRGPVLVPLQFVDLHES